MPYDPFADIDCRPAPTATPAWYIENQTSSLFTGPFRNSIQLGEYLRDVDPLIPTERVVHVAAQARCQAGHPIIAMTTGRFWLTIAGDKILDASVSADLGDPGNLGATVTVFGCSVKDCEAEITDEASELAKGLVDTPSWPLMHTGDRSFIRMEG